MRKNYIITLNDGYTPEQFYEIAKKYSMSIIVDYDALTKLYKVNFDDTDKSAVKAEPVIYHVAPEEAKVNLMVKVRTAPISNEPNLTLTATPQQYNSVSVNQFINVSQTGYGGNWGLARICQKNNWNDNTWYPYSGKFESWRTASNVDIYIVDTGINKNHNDFKNRFTIIYDHYRNSSDPNFGGDLNGHGTHVASIAAGTTYGVAKKAMIKVSRVFETDGTTLDAVVAGINACLKDHNNKKAANINRPSVINLSLGGPAAKTEEMVVNACIDAGMVVVTAAGNDGMDLAARGYDVMPAEISRAITVGASDIKDKIANFSNYGSMVDVFAPGLYITAADWRTNSGENMLSGTSMASPFVAGVCALKLEEKGILKSATEVKSIHDWIVSTSTLNTLHFSKQHNLSKTPNKMLYCGFVSETTAVKPVVEQIVEVDRKTTIVEKTTTSQSAPFVGTKHEDKTTVYETELATTTTITRYYTKTTYITVTTTITKTPTTVITYSDKTTKTITEQPIVSSKTEDVVQKVDTYNEIISNVVVPKPVVTKPVPEKQKETIVETPYVPNENHASKYKTARSSKKWNTGDKQVSVFLEMLDGWEKKFQIKYPSGNDNIEIKMIEITELMFKYSTVRGALRTALYRKFNQLRDEINSLL